jgi:hypothetical protein
VLGNHSIRIGADLYWEQDNDTEAFAARPSYNFRNLWDFANDAPYQENGNFNPLTGAPTSATKYIRSNIWAGFVQDDYRVKPNLTLNLGLRWEYFTPVREKYGNISNALLGNGPDPLLGTHVRVGGDLYNASKNNWGPQFGFAWTPPNSQRFVVRGGVGIGYNRMEEAITLNGRANPPLVTNLTLMGSNIIYATPSSTTGSNAFYNWPVNPAALQTFNSAGLPANGAPVNLTGFQQDLPTPVVYRFSFDPEYNIGGNWVAKLGYQGSLSRHYTRQLNWNTFFYPLNPQIQSFYWYGNDANSEYHALLSELSHSFARSFQLDVQYRWSHTIDEGSNDYFIGEYPYGLQYARGSADFDVRHNVKIWGLWDTHSLLKGHNWFLRLLGEWQLSGILTWHTGFPWTPEYSNYGCNIVYPGSGYCSLRPAAYLGGRGFDFSNSAFQSGPNPSNPTAANNNFPNGALAYFTVPNYIPLPGVIPPAPSVGRNTLTGPGFLGDDFSLQKTFPLPKLPILGENARFDFRGDFYNLFNVLNLNPQSISNQISYDGVHPNINFGQAQNALAARIIQFQVRFSF